MLHKAYHWINLEIIFFIYHKNEKNLIKLRNLINDKIENLLIQSLPNINKQSGMLLYLFLSIPD